MYTIGSYLPWHLAAAISAAVPVILGKYSEDPVAFGRIQSRNLGKLGSGSDLAAARSAAVPVILGSYGVVGSFHR